MKARKTAILLVLLAWGAGWSSGADADRTGNTLQQQQRTLSLQLRRERAALLRDDPEISAIHARIRKLYRELDAALAAKPAIRELQGQLDAVESALEQQRRGDPGP